MGKLFLKQMSLDTVANVDRHTMPSLRKTAPTGGANNENLGTIDKKNCKIANGYQLNHNSLVLKIFSGHPKGRQLLPTGAKTA